MGHSDRAQSHRTAPNKGKPAKVSSMVEAQLCLTETVYQPKAETKRQIEAQWAALRKRCAPRLAEMKYAVSWMQYEVSEIARSSKYRSKRGYDNAKTSGEKDNTIDLKVVGPEVDDLAARLGRLKVAYDAEHSLKGRFGITRLQEIALQLGQLDEDVSTTHDKFGSR
ncbi:hypothetical protein PG995_010820 [Apiospora arundinis]